MVKRLANLNANTTKQPYTLLLRKKVFLLLKREDFRYTLPVENRLRRCVRSMLG